MGQAPHGQSFCVHFASGAIPVQRSLLARVRLSLKMDRLYLESYPTGTHFYPFLPAVLASFTSLSLPFPQISLFPSFLQYTILTLKSAHRPFQPDFVTPQIPKNHSIPSDQCANLCKNYTGHGYMKLFEESHGSRGW